MSSARDEQRMGRAAHGLSGVWVEGRMGWQKDHYCNSRGNVETGARGIRKCQNLEMSGSSLFTA